MTRSKVTTMMTLAVLIAGSMGQAQAPDRLVQARQAYNAGQFDAAITAATDALKIPALANPAAVVLARAHLGRYDATNAATDLEQARMALRLVVPERLSHSQRRDDGSVSGDGFRDRRRVRELACDQPKIGVREGQPCHFADEGRHGVVASECLPDDFTTGLTRSAKDEHLHAVARAPGGTMTRAAARARIATIPAST